MAANEGRRRAHQRLDRPQYPELDAADVDDHGAGARVRNELCRHGANRLHRHGEDQQVRTSRSLRGAAVVAIDRPPREGGLQVLFASSIPHHLPGQGALTRHQPERGADQAHAGDHHALEQRHI